MDAPPLRWGVLGNGWIADKFVTALHESTRQVVQAVGSRSAEGARRAADAFGATTAHASYEALVADPEVDVVYVATPHHLHLPHALLAIAAGKHVLVEKPVGLDAGEARMVGEAVARAGVFCMEAMWSLFLPRFDIVRQLLADGVVGEPRVVLADMGEWFDDGHRIMRPELAGGPMLDLGTYPVTLATWVLGPATRVLASGESTASGVNGQAAMLLTHAGDATSVLHSTLLTRTPTAATIAGTEATLTLPGPFFMPGDVVVTSADGSGSVTWTDPEPIGHGALYHSAVEAARCIGDGLLASPLHDAASVHANMSALDEVTRQLGITYSPNRKNTPSPGTGH